MGFDALVGQEHVVRALRHALDAGRLHHAYLFTGTRGVGKTTIARIVAKSLNCERGVSATPCGECSICLEVKENRFIDLIEVDAASRTGVDDTRDLLDNAQYLPTRGRYKVYLIDEVHMLSTASFNALLKTLEEPPEHVKFLLATTDPKKVPVTVLSRCLQFQLKNLSRDAIATYLAEVLGSEDVEFELPALDVIARSASGSMRDALSLTDQAIAYGQGALRTAEVTDMLGVVGRDEVSSLIDAIGAGSTEQLMALSAELAERSADFSDVLKGLLEALHDLAVQAALQGDVSAFSPAELQLYYQIALHGYRDLTITPDERSGFEMTLLRMLAFAPNPGSKVPPKDPTPSREVSQAADSEAKRSASSQKSASLQNSEPQADANASVAARKDAVEPVAQTPAATLANSPLASVDTPSPVKAPSPTEEASAAPVKSVIETSELSQRWYEMVAKLNVGGVTRMIAEHSVLLSLALPKVELLLHQGHDTLLNPAQSTNLERALEEAFGESVDLVVTTGMTSTETPAERRDREQRERQAHAEQAIEQDDNVRNLLAEFGGRVDQIRPI